MENLLAQAEGDVVTQVLLDVAVHVSDGNRALIPITDIGLAGSSNFLQEEATPRVLLTGLKGDMAGALQVYQSWCRT